MVTFLKKSHICQHTPKHSRPNIHKETKKDEIFVVDKISFEGDIFMVGNIFTVEKVSLLWGF